MNHYVMGIIFFIISVSTAVFAAFSTMKKEPSKFFINATFFIMYASMFAAVYLIAFYG